MLIGEGMFGRPRGGDRVVRSRAMDRARWAIRDHGDEAEAVIAAKLARPGASPGDRELHRLTLRELRILRRERALTIAADARNGPLATLAILLFGPRKGGRRRS